MDRETGSRSRSGLNVMDEISKMEQELKDFQTRIMNRKINNQLEKETDAYQTAKSGLDLVRDLGIFGITPKKQSEVGLQDSKRHSQQPPEDLLAAHSFSFETKPKSSPMDEESRVPVCALDSKTGDTTEFAVGLAAKSIIRAQTVALPTTAQDSSSFAGLSNPVPTPKPEARQAPKSKLSLPTAGSIQSSQPLARPVLSQEESDLLANYLKLTNEDLAKLAASFGIKDRGRETMKRMVKEVHDWYYLDKVGREVVRGFKETIVEQLQEKQQPLDAAAK